MLFRTQAPQRRRPSLKSGFTLIELLVVIAIIAILASILFPAFSRARENARRASCMSNLKQLSLAVFQYTQDYDERLPNQVAGTPGKSNVGGWVFYSVYKGAVHTDPSVFDPTQGNLYPYIKNAQVFVCPSDTFDQGNSYGMNSCLVAPLNTANAQGLLAGKKLTRFINTSDWMLFGEEAQTANSVSDSSNDGYFDLATDYFSIRHLEGSNVAFLDGHVKWFKPDAAVKAGYQTGGASQPSPTGTACPT